MNNYPENFENKIGFDKIREFVRAKCLSSLGEEEVDKMAFSSDYTIVNTELNRTGEFIRILQEEENFPFSYYFDVRGALKKVRIEGTYLLEREVFDIRRSLQTIHEIVRFFEIKKEESNAYPFLQELASDIISFPGIIKQIDRILDKFGGIKDSASPELSRIRQDLAQTMGSISKTLQSILRSAQSEGFVEKDVNPTMRDGRLVIPISPAYKRKLRGIVHDESASGKTVFIEPAEVVEANNRIRELENEEKREVVRILTDFTNFIRPEIPSIIFSYIFLGKIDFIRAKALFALDLGAILPELVNEQKIEWVRAVHPLLYLSHKRQNKEVVPLDIELDATNRLLLISGPNAGGKSVCLKTVGLLQCMLQSGLLIPLHESSRVGLFDGIFIDIGDEQSIENDLSTYSSHLTNMKYFVKHCSPKTLILIDEFGSGTEPQIGGAIAEALLDRFNKNKSFGIITTHYQNLKHYAEETDGVINGAMLYDRHEMRPLFKLSIGNPGSSFAIEIARKIGLPEDVIADASSMVGQDYVNMDKYLQDIVRDKRYWENKRQNIRQQEKRLEELTNKYKVDIEDIDKQRKEIIARAKSDAERLLADTNAKIENTIREIREAQAEKERTRSVRKSLDNFKESLQAQGDKNEDKLERKIKKLKERDEKKKIKKVNPQQSNFDPDNIVVGDAVRMKGQRTVGEILEIKAKNAIVAFGSIKSTVKIEQLEKVSKNQIKKENTVTSRILSNHSDSFSEKKLHFKLEIDVRGMRGEEALQAVTYYIDDAIQCNAGRIRILHGTGTGALRQIIRDYLRTVPGISSYHDEHVQFGGSGITVVEFD